ncbi:hypothetical protein ACRRVB_02210 [Candidatus Cardinium hertigii]|uniref:hypothetical protein n=1 Tax=Candidatus Cardinium hertigii TaxID=247481 RepID=UPI003D7DE75D
MKKQLSLNMIFVAAYILFSAKMCHSLPNNRPINQAKPRINKYTWKNTKIDNPSENSYKYLKQSIDTDNKTVQQTHTTLTDNKEKRNAAPLKENNTSIPTTSIDRNMDNHSKKYNQPRTNTEKTNKSTYIPRLADNKANNPKPVQEKNTFSPTPTPTTPKPVAIVQPISNNSPIVNHSEVDYKKTDQSRTNTKKIDKKIYYIKLDLNTKLSYEEKNEKLNELIQINKTIDEQQKKILALQNKLTQLQEIKNREKEIINLQETLNLLQENLNRLQQIKEKIDNSVKKTLMKYHYAVVNKTRQNQNYSH